MALDFERGRVAILGTGREGRAARDYLRGRYPGIALALISEAAPEKEFVADLSDRDRLCVGPLSQAGLAGYDILVRSPGISPYRNSIRRAVASGAVVTTPSNLWFAAHGSENTVCITGTKGKSTTAALLAHFLSACGSETRLAGNIGQPLLACDDRGVDWWVIELSSYQLADLDARPTVAVILNLSPEHLDWHGGEAAYRSDKLRLARLAAGRPRIINAADAGLLESFRGDHDVTWFNAPGGFRVKDGRLFDDETPFPARLPPELPGEHNLSNVAAALTVMRQIGADLTAAAAALPGFRGLPHRLELIGEKNGICFVDDSISSTPVATVAALEAYRGQTVTLLLGGLDRGLDWSPYIDRIRSMLPAAIMGIPDSGDRLIRLLRDAGVEPPLGLHPCTDLEQAMFRARELTPGGGVVLLSPGAPSFPRFRDFQERGRRFAELAGIRPAKPPRTGDTG
jgi:UDP-N-acetylmuramoylalanine--D-glutamate ligase